MKKQRIFVYVYEKFAGFSGDFVPKLGGQVALLCGYSKAECISKVNDKFNANEHVYSFTSLK